MRSGDRVGVQPPANSIDIVTRYGVLKIEPKAVATIAFQSDESGVHELYLLCDDLETEMASLAKKNVVCSAVQEARWGSITKMQLPGGGEIGLYQPKHPTALGLRSK